MTREELDRIDFELRPIAIGERCEADARRAVSRFNADVASARSQLEAMRALTVAGDRPQEDAKMQLRAAAVLWANERARIVDRYRLRSS
jgi:hypothetical protein